MEPQPNLLDSIRLTPEAYQAWVARSRQAARRMQDLAIDPRDVPQEQAWVLDDGSLRIFVDVPVLGRVDLVIGPDEWTYVC
jgi:hypothetical protein